MSPIYKGGVDQGSWQSVVIAILKYPGFSFDPRLRSNDLIELIDVSNDTEFVEQVSYANKNVQEAERWVLQHDRYVKGCLISHKLTTVWQKKVLIFGTPTDGALHQSKDVLANAVTKHWYEDDVESQVEEGHSHYELFFRNELGIVSEYAKLVNDQESQQVDESVPQTRNVLLDKVLD